MPKIPVGAWNYIPSPFKSVPLQPRFVYAPKNTAKPGHYTPTSSPVQNTTRYQVPFDRKRCMLSPFLVGLWADFLPSTGVKSTEIRAGSSEGRNFCASKLCTMVFESCETKFGMVVLHDNNEKKLRAGLFYYRIAMKNNQILFPNSQNP